MDCISVGRMGQIITPITKNFFRITEVFPDALLHRLQSTFCYVKDWSREPNIQGTRLASSSIDYPFTMELQDSLDPVKKFIESNIGKKTYWNGPVLWHDESGYLNAIHKDQSENVAVNVQVYLNNGDDVQGTFFENDGEWYSVPYECNTGYIMFWPTKHDHGMKHASNTYRQSFYQSLRVTEEMADWETYDYYDSEGNVKKKYK